MPQSRKLVAIMFTDIEGYKTLMGEDEQKALIFIYKSCWENSKKKALLDQFMSYARENTKEDPRNLPHLDYMQGDFRRSIKWEEKVVEGRYPLARKLNIRLFYSAA